VVHDIERVITIVDDLELVGERLGIEYLANELDVHRVTVHDNDAQRRCRSIRTCHSSGGAVRASHTRPGKRNAQAYTLHDGSTMRLCGCSLGSIPP